MRFEVNVDDGDNLRTLHKAREAYNALNAKVEGFVPVLDMPSFVQRLIDQAVAVSMAPLGPTTLSAAMTKIAALEADKATLEAELAAIKP